jgi:hypothetical protein
MPTHHVVWRFAYILDGATLRREYRTHLTISRGLEEMGDVTRWVAPTLVQFCLGCEIIRREMWSAEGSERARTTSLLASNKLGNLALGRAPGVTRV